MFRLWRGVRTPLAASWDLSARPVLRRLPAVAKLGTVRRPLRTIGVAAAFAGVRVGRGTRPAVGVTLLRPTVIKLEILEFFAVKI